MSICAPNSIKKINLLVLFKYQTFYSIKCIGSGKFKQNSIKINNVVEKYL